MGRKERRTTKLGRLPESRVGGGGQEPSSTAATAADRLSSLPDEVLHSIVSRLPAREVVRMSVLSRRWRRVPSLLPVLDLLDLSSRRRKREEEKEEEVFDWVAYWGLIRRCVFWSRTREGNKEWAFDQWAETIAAKGIRELELFLGDQHFDAYPILHHCKSLIKLKLNCCGLYGEIGASPRCADLRELNLECVGIRDDLLQGLVSTCCPRLETLRMWDCPEFARLQISAAPSLRRLEFGYQDPHPDYWDEAEFVGVVVDAPKLEHVHLRVRPAWCEKFTIRSPKLTSLRIHLIEEKEEPASDEERSIQEESDEDGSLQEESGREGFLLEESGSDSSLQEEWWGQGPLRGCRLVAEELIRLLNNATKFFSLQLTGATIQCLSTVVASISFRPSFVSLTRLSIELTLRDQQQASCLAKLLRHCNCLQALKLFVSQRLTKDDSLHNKVPFYPVTLFWEHQKILQQMGCLSHHLQEVTMYGLAGEIYEMKLACFFLVEARALKKLSLKFRTYCREALDIIAKHLPNLKRGSSEAKLELASTEYELY